MSSVSSPKNSSTKTVLSNGANAENGLHSNGHNGIEKRGFEKHGVQGAFPFAPKPLTAPKTIVKRDGRVMPFEASRIEGAIRRCFAGLGIKAATPIEEITARIVNVVSVRHEEPTVEQVQDIVETVLQAAGEYEAAKSYILYRAEHERMRSMRPVPESVREAFEQSALYFPTQLQKFQFYDKYSRFNYDLGRRETWIETVDRSVDFLQEISENRLSADLYGELRSGILQMKASPSMRLLAMAGPAARRNNIAIYNCSYMPVDGIDSFVEALIISMSGCGVGYSVESKYIEKFPRVRRQNGAAPLKYVVPDSSEGWAEAVRVGIETWFDGGDILFDYSEVRPAGAPLYTKGGRASGPEPLRQMLEFARGRILARQGSFIHSLDAHDIMCAVGNAAVSGGVRRTAMIALFDMDDSEMRFSKSGDNIVGNEQRWNANNSAVWPEQHLSQAKIARYLLDMVESGRGEPGIFSRGAANRTRPERRAAADFGTNPCVTGDTWVMTANGPRQADKLLSSRFTALVDGEEHCSTEDGFFFTGHQDIYLVETVEGYKLRATAEHPVLKVTTQTRKKQYTEWSPISDLVEGDLIRLNNQRGASWEAEGKSASVGWLLGLLIGDGTFVRNETKNNSALLRFWGEKSQMMVEMAHAILTTNIPVRSDMQPMWHPTNKYWQLSSTGLATIADEYGIDPDNKNVTDKIEQASSSFYSGFLRGLFDADGTVLGEQSKGISVRLAQSNLELLQRVQRMLLRLGIASSIYQNRREEGYRHLPDGRGGTKAYWTKAQHELVVSRENIITFQERVGFSDPDKAARLSDKIGNYRKQPDRERFVARIKSITYIGKEDVYDCTVPGVHAFDANGLYVHNCGEISLRPMELCNLSIAIARPNDTFETLAEKVRLATVIGTIQSMATHFPGLRPQWKENCEDERLLGVDINGQLDSPAAQDADVQRRLKGIAIETNRVVAAELGINQSASVTCVKPSGNSSQLFDCSPGIHTRWSPYYIRNVRVGTHTPLFKVLRDAGVPMDPENGQMPESANTWVIHFPVKAPDGSITRNDRTAIEQCNYWLQCKTEWTEHNPSVTITFQPDEVLDIIKWVWENQDKIGGMTFLPAFDAQYDQMPYEEITQEQYEKLIKEFPSIDFSKVYRYENKDLTTAAQELACFAGSCEIM